MTKNCFRYQVALVTLILDLASIPVLTSQAIASSNVAQTSVRRQANEVAQYVPPRGLGAPSITAGGGTRSGGCEQEEPIGQQPTALIPNLDNPEDNWALTVEANPEIFVYLPRTSVRTAKFVLKDEDYKQIYKTDVTISGQAGIGSISLPKNVSLAVGKSYHWYLVILCNPNSEADYLAVEGWIYRKEKDSSLASQLQNAAERDVPKVYQRNGIWYEAVSSLAQLRRKNPNDTTLASEWKKLLESAGLKELESFPIVTALQTSR